MSVRVLVIGTKYGPVLAFGDNSPEEVRREPVTLGGEYIDPRAPVIHEFHFSPTELCDAIAYADEKNRGEGDADSD